MSGKQCQLFDTQIQLMRNRGSINVTWGCGMIECPSQIFREEAVADPPQNNLETNIKRVNVRFFAHKGLRLYLPALIIAYSIL